MKNHIPFEGLGMTAQTPASSSIYIHRVTVIIDAWMWSWLSTHGVIVDA